MNISIEKYNIHCIAFNSMSVKELQDLYNSDDLMYDVSSTLYYSLTLYLPQRLFKEIDNLNKLK